eukprot:9741552-Karenia_brevis.AAC.1
MWSLNQQKQSVNAPGLGKNKHFVHDGDGSYSTNDSCVCPNNQVCDLSYGYNSNIDSDVKFLGRSLFNEPGLVVFNAWLKEDTDPQDKLKHLDKVLTYAKYEN